MIWAGFVWILMHSVCISQGMAGWAPSQPHHPRIPSSGSPYWRRLWPVHIYEQFQGNMAWVFQVFVHSSHQFLNQVLPGWVPLKNRGNSLEASTGRKSLWSSSNMRWPWGSKCWVLTIPCHSSDGWWIKGAPGELDGLRNMGPSISTNNNGYISGLQ